jgi:hypothetical protein
MRVRSVLLAVFLMGATLSASTDSPTEIAAHAKESKKVVVATVTDVQSSFDDNEFGERLIVSTVSYRVDETMKGPRDASGVVTVEGGTVGDLTLSVSDMPRMVKGDRAVLFLNDSPKGGHIPHGRGHGLLKLDSNDRVNGTTLTLDDIRAAVKGAGQ